MPPQKPRDNRVNLLTVDDSLLRSMAANPEMQKLMPGLKQVQTQLESVKKGKANCNKCQKEKKRIIAAALQKARAVVTSVRGDNRNQLKRMLNAKQLRVLTRKPNGKPLHWTL